MNIIPESKALNKHILNIFILFDKCVCVFYNNKLTGCYYFKKKILTKYLLNFKNSHPVTVSPTETFNINKYCIKKTHIKNIMRYLNAPNNLLQPMFVV